MNFSSNTRSAATGIALSLVIVVCVSLVASLARAEEPCQTKADLTDLKDIKKNQAILSDNRPDYTAVHSAFEKGQQVDPEQIDGYNAYIEARGWNKSEVDSLASRGCEVDWSTLTLRPLALRP